MPKQFIRHLEYYGFPDQNTYTSEMNSIDLSDIREKNKEQDEAIDKIDKKEAASQRDLARLNITVNNFINQQNIVNTTVSEVLDGLEDDVTNLKENSNTFAEELSGVTDAVNALIDDVDTINAEISAITPVIDDIASIISDIEELSGKVETLSAETISGFTKAREDLDGYSVWAEDRYMQKVSAYTKDEIDDKLSGMATKAWVNGQGFVTYESGDTRYAKNSRVDEIENDLNVAKEEIGNEISALTSSVEDGFNDINNKIGSLSGISDDINDRIDALEGRVDVVENDIVQVESDIDNLEETKANKSELASVSGVLVTKIDIVEGKIDDKVDFDTYNANNVRISNIVNDLDARKADKSALNELSNRIGDVGDDLAVEIQNRINADNALSERITVNTNNIVTIKSKNAEQDIEIADLNDKLNQEITDRRDGDLALIGTSADTKLSNTIIGAKKYADTAQEAAQLYADNVASEAVASANTYTDGLIYGDDGILAKISGKADKAYVDAKNADTKSELRQEIDDNVDGLTTLIEAEVTRAKGAEGELRSNIFSTDEALHNLATNVRAITSWDGSDPTQYVDTGNGVLDVLHREFHEYVENDGIIESIEYDGTNLIIKYKTPEGEKTTIIPVGTLVDLTNYYNKQEIDGKLSVIEQNVEDNAEAIESISGKVESADDKIDGEIIRATSSELELEAAINNEIRRATNEESNINNRIDNLILDCGLY